MWLTDGLTKKISIAGFVVLKTSRTSGQQKAGNQDQARHINASKINHAVQKPGAQHDGDHPP